MGSTDQDIGYIKGKVESLETRIEDQEEQLDAISIKLDEISGQLGLYRHVLMFIRTVLWTGAAIVTLKFGDIPSLWKGE